jgi:2-oxoglutarate dehydrogenase E2 component (dihydrolipoamide succinyltransferase)
MDVVMPRLGESIVEATLVAWRVSVGQAVQRGEVLAEVETDKATNEIPSPTEGRVSALTVPEGATVPVGAVILRLDDGKESAPTAPPSASSTDRPTATGAAAGRSRLAPHPVDASGRPQRTSPAVRRRARMEGLDLDRIAGTGRRGRITLADLDRSEASPAPRSDWPMVVPDAADEVRPISPRRRAIGRNLRTSLDTAVHVFAVTEIDLAAVERLRDRLPSRPGLLAVVCRALVQALNQFPELNGTVQGDRFIVRRSRNLGIATDTDRGLLVPVIHDAQHLSLDGLHAAIQRLAAQAREGDLDLAAQADGTFTVSNPGRLGNTFGVSIIRPPEVAILRLGSVTKRPVVVTEQGEDRLVIRPIMMAALTYDHRVIDGSLANRFLDRVRSELEAATDLA